MIRLMNHGEPRRAGRVRMWEGSEGAEGHKCRVTSHMLEPTRPLLISSVFLGVFCGYALSKPGVVKSLRGQGI